MFKRKKDPQQTTDNVISRKAFREYQRENGLDEPSTKMHRMRDGRLVDQNGEIYTSSEDVPDQREATQNQRLRQNKRYDVDKVGNLTVLEKQRRLKFRLNIAIIILVLLIITTFLILRFVG